MQEKPVISELSKLLGKNEVPLYLRTNQVIKKKKEDIMKLKQHY